MDKIKEFVKKYKKHISGAVIVLLILVWAFWYGGNAPGARGFKLEKTEEGLTTEAVGGAELTETTKSATEENTDAGNDRKKKSDSSVTDISSETHSDSDTSETEYQTSAESTSENVTERNSETTTEKKTEATTKKNTTTESQKQRRISRGPRRLRKSGNRIRQLLILLPRQRQPQRIQLRRRRKPTAALYQ